SGRPERSGAVETVDCARMVDVRPGALGRPKSGSPDDISPTGPVVCRESGSGALRESDGARSSTSVGVGDVSADRCTFTVLATSGRGAVPTKGASCGVAAGCALEAVSPSSEDLRIVSENGCG